jgi:hypothetical protein
VIDDMGIDRLVPSVTRELTTELARAPIDRWVALSPYACEALPKFAAAHGIRAGRSTGTRSSGCRASDICSRPGGARLPRCRGIGRLCAPRATPSCPRSSVADSSPARRSAPPGSGTAFAASEDELAQAPREARRTATSGSRRTSAGLPQRQCDRDRAQGIAVGYPSVQITDQDALNCSGGRHCGNDFSATATLEQSLIESVREQTIRIGQWMASHGYRGLFGVDFVIDERPGCSNTVDVNPRWQGSTTLQTQAERRQGRLPLAAVETAYRLGVMDAREVMTLSPTFFEPLQGSQLFRRISPPEHGRREDD